MNKEEFLKMFNKCVKDGDISFDTEKYGDYLILHLEIKVDGMKEKHQIMYFEK